MALVNTLPATFYEKSITSLSTNSTDPSSIQVIMAKSNLEV